ncbi:daptide-type RiPP biosynthesis methyltransferase [Microbacterium sp. PMB16]|uniref:daptide-type RiPP biosynthesis methyltransferase n=1 Tax=Microbacterium sp. PMB16 TaxID=3120157 RepID=UPI003F4C4EAA
MSEPHLTRSAAQLLAALDPDATVDELYGERGSEIYDAMTAGDDSEVREILRAGSRTRGSILELACGGGRLTLPLARLGRDVVALDSSPRMLEMLEARARSAGVDRIHPLLGDMSSFDLEQEFGLIVLATTSVTLLPEAARRTLFAAVRRHLAPDGVFLISVHAVEVGRTRAGTMLVPLSSGEPDVVLLTEEVNDAGGYRDVSVVRVRRSQGELVTEAFASRVHLIEESGLREELHRSGLVVDDVAAVRFTEGVRSVSMIACSR